MYEKIFLEYRMRDIIKEMERAINDLEFKDRMRAYELRENLERLKTALRQLGIAVW